MELLNWTGHPLVDVGIATLCAMLEKTAPEQLTLEDLDRAAEQMRRYYFSGVMTSYLSCVFMNSEYVQPGEATKKAASREAYAKRVLYAHRITAPEDAAKGLTCVFSGQPATHVIHRGQMPLITGEGVLNFMPGGQGGIAIAGPYLTALQALPLGGRRTEGRLLICHADSADLNIRFAEKYWIENRRLLNLMLENQLPPESGGVDPSLRAHLAYDKKESRHKMPDAKGWATLILTDLGELIQDYRGAQHRRPPTSLTVYWLSSSGQGPSLDIHYFPSNLVQFLEEVTKATTANQWKHVVANGWRAEKDEPTGPGLTRNRVFQDLAAIFQSGITDRHAAERFLNRHLLRANLQGDRWAITDLFLKRVFLMTTERIESIRQFADNLVRYMQELNDTKFAANLSYAKKPHDFRTLLIKAQRRALKGDMPLPFGFDDYIRTFHSDDAIGIWDWALVRDLIMIRMVEQLKAAGVMTADLGNMDEETEETAQPAA